jgi:hypothetical protein
MLSHDRLMLPGVVACCSYMFHHYIIFGRGVTAFDFSDTILFDYLYAERHYKSIHEVNESGLGWRVGGMLAAIQFRIFLSQIETCKTLMLPAICLGVKLGIHVMRVGDSRAPRGIFGRKRYEVIETE